MHDVLREIQDDVFAELLQLAINEENGNDGGETYAYNNQ